MSRATGQPEMKKFDVFGIYDVIAIVHMHSRTRAHHQPHLHKQKFNYPIEYNLFTWPFLVGLHYTFFRLCSCDTSFPEGFTTMAMASLLQFTFIYDFRTTILLFVRRTHLIVSNVHKLIWTKWFPFIGYSELMGWTFNGCIRGDIKNTNFRCENFGTNEHRFDKETISS